MDTATVRESGKWTVPGPPAQGGPGNRRPKLNPPNPFGPASSQDAD